VSSLFVVYKIRDLGVKPNSLICDRLLILRYLNLTIYTLTFPYIFAIMPLDKLISRYRQVSLQALIQGEKQCQTIARPYSTGSRETNTGRMQSLWLELPGCASGLLTLLCRGRLPQNIDKLIPEDKYLEILDEARKLGVTSVGIPERRAVSSQSPEPDNEGSAQMCRAGNFRNRLYNELGSSRCLRSLTN